MANYVLLLDATVGSADALNGDFDNDKGTWVSDLVGFGKKGDDSPRGLGIGDTMTVAVRVNSSDATKANGGIGYYSNQLNFVVVTINGKTGSSSKLDSPFQIPGRPDPAPVWPLMLGNRDGAGNLNKFFRYSADTGALGGKGDYTDYLGLVRATVMISGKFKFVVCAEVNGTDVTGKGVYCQFSHDPEIDTGQG